MSLLTLKFAYDGRKFYGFQRQLNQRTVEGEIRNTLKRIGINDYTYASRTDRGVSALGNVLVLSTDISPNGIVAYLNSSLSDIFFHSYSVVDEDFNPRHANERWYRYILPTIEQNGENPAVLLNGTPISLNIERAKRAARLFLGYHDFSNFCRANEAKETVRRILNVDIRLEQRITGLPPFLIIDIRGESFLWMMVRYIVGAIFESAGGKREVEEIAHLLNKSAGLSSIRKPVPAPPEPLILMDVSYSGLKFQRAIEALKLVEGYAKFMNGEAAMFEVWLTLGKPF